MQETAPAPPLERRAKVRLLVLTVGFFLFLAGSALWRFHAGHAYASELGCSTNVAWHASHGRFGPISYESHGIRQNIHFVPLHYALGYLFGFLPLPELLLVSQALAFALGVPLAFWIARRLEGSEEGAWIVALAYVLTPSVYYVNQIDYHEVVFALPALMLGILGLLEGSPGKTATGFALAAMTREDTGLTVAWTGFLVAALWPARRRWGGLLGVAGGVFWILVVKVFHNQQTGATQHPMLTMLFGHLGSNWGEILRTLAFSPLQAIRSSYHPLKLVHAALFFVPTLGIPLAAPELVAAGIPYFGYTYLTLSRWSLDIRVHYCSVFLPFLVAAFALGLRRVAARLEARWPRGPGAWRRRLGGAVLGWSLVFWIVLQVLFPANRGFLRPRAWVAHLDTLRRLVPPEASVLAHEGIFVHFVERDRADIYHRVPLDGPDFDWILVSLREREWPSFWHPEVVPPYTASLEYLEAGDRARRYEVAFEADGVVALRRDPGGDHPETLARLRALRAGG